jgi:hypothetical protein
MGTVRHSRRPGVNYLTDGPIGPYVDAFKRYLSERRYAARTSASYLAAIAHFARWARSKRLALHRIDEGSIVKFLDDHLPRCCCTGPTRHDRGDHSAALGHLLEVLRAQGAIAAPSISTTPVDEELLRYDEYMAHVRGLMTKTRSSALRIIRRLLVARFGEGPIDVVEIKPEFVRRFFARQAELYSDPASASLVVTSLRVLPRQLEAVIATQDAECRRGCAAGRRNGRTRQRDAARRCHRALRLGSGTSQLRGRKTQP